jgi:hypothetical protein
MARPLRDFLLHLSDNPEATTRFGTSDEAATAMMTAAGLTEDQREALLARGLAEVSAAWNREWQASGAPATLEAETPGLMMHEAPEEEPADEPDSDEPDEEST